MIRIVEDLMFSYNLLADVLANCAAKYINSINVLRFALMLEMSGTCRLPTIYNDNQCAKNRARVIDTCHYQMYLHQNNLVNNTTKYMQWSGDKIMSLAFGLQDVTLEKDKLMRAEKLLDRLFPKQLSTNIS